MFTDWTSLPSLCLCCVENRRSENVSLSGVKQSWHHPVKKRKLSPDSSITFPLISHSPHIHQSSDLLDLNEYVCFHSDYVKHNINPAESESFSWLEESINVNIPIALFQFLYSGWTEPVSSVLTDVMYSDKQSSWQCPVNVTTFLWSFSAAPHFSSCWIHLLLFESSPVGTHLLLKCSRPSSPTGFALCFCKLKETVFLCWASFWVSEHKRNLTLFDSFHFLL